MICRPSQRPEIQVLALLGCVLAVWSSRPAAGDGIRLLGPVVEISNDNFELSRASYNPASDHYLILWNRAESPNLRLVGRLMNASTGALAGPTFQVGPNSGVGTPVYNPDEGLWFVVYHSDADIGGDIYAQKVGAAGPVGGQILLYQRASFQQRPHAAYDFKRKRYLVAWSDYRPGKPEIRAGFFDPNGVPIAGLSELLISEYTTKHQNDPVIAFNPSADEFLIVWVDVRNDIYRPPHITNDNNYVDLYGQRINAITGATIGHNIPVNSPYVPGSPYVGDGQDTLGGLLCNTTPGSPGYGLYFLYIQKLTDLGWTTQARMFNADASPRGAVFNVSHPLRGGVSGCVYNPHDDTYMTSYLDQSFNVSGQQFTATGEALRGPATLVAEPDWEENYGSLAVRPSDGQYLQVTTKFENFVTHERPAIIVARRCVRDVTPPLSSDGVTATPGLRRVTLGWTNPAAEDFQGTLIRFRADRCPADPTDGTRVIDKPGSSGIADSFVHAGLTPGATYHYAFFSHDGTANHAAGVCASVTISPPGDTDLDGDVDQNDFGFFQNCLTGDQKAPPPGCEDADFDTDGDVDDLDFTSFRDCLGGAGLPPGC